MRSGRLLYEELRAERIGDELAVEASILDEDLVGALAGHDDAGKVDAGYVGLKRAGVANRAAIIGLVQADAKALNEGEVGVVAGKGEDKVVFKGESALRRLQDHLIFGDVLDGA